MTEKSLIIDPMKCNGCRDCEVVCAMACTGIGNPALSRIRVVEWNRASLFVPISCRQCEEAPCIVACPREALFREETLGRVGIDYGRCISCRMCVAACPFGAMAFDPLRQRVFKCDLCDGDPQCVRFCAPAALRFDFSETAQYQRIRRTARLQAGRKGKNP